MKLFNKAIDNKLFKQYALGSDLSRQEVVAKIFNPQGAQSWFILNSDPEDPDYLWAIVDLGYGAEIGSVSRNELESYRGRFGLGFERDLSFDPINAEELYEGLRAGKNYADGGNIDKIKEGDKVVYKDNVYFVSKIQMRNVRGLYDVQYHLTSYKRNLQNVVVDDVKFIKKFADGGSLGNYDVVIDGDWDEPKKFKTFSLAKKWIYENIKNHESLELVDSYGDTIYVEGDATKEDLDWLFSNNEASAFADGGEVSFIDYKDCEIMYEPHYKKYYANDVEFDSLKEAKEFIDSGEIDPSIRDAYSKGLFADGGSVNVGYNVFNYTDNIYATDEVFKTKALANKFIKEFRSRFSNQGYYRDNRMNKINIQDIDLLAIPSDFNPFKKYADGGGIENKIQTKNFADLKQGDVIRRKEKLGTTIFVVVKSPVQSRAYKNEYNALVTCIVGNTDYYKPFEEYHITSVIKYGKLGNVDYIGKWNHDDEVDYSKYLPKSNKKYADGGDISEFSDNQRMIMNQNVELEHHHEELEDILEDEMPVPAWVVAKMATATNSVSDVTHYLDGQKELMEDESEEEDEDEDEQKEEYGEFDYSTIDPTGASSLNVFEPINVSAGTKAELTKKFTDDAWGNLRGFLKGMEGIDLRNDYTFDYKNEQFEVEPIINSDENGVSNAVFTIFDGDGEEVGEVAYSREGGKQKFTANSDYFQWNDAKFEDGGYFDGTIPNVSTYMTNYAKGGEIAKAEILGLSKNIMGTTDIEMKITGMRKPQDFIVYPIGKDDAGNVITIQSDTRIGQINLVKGVGVMSQSHSNGAYFVHLQMDKLTSFTISESDLEDLKAHIFKTSGANVGTRGVVTDNSGASGVYAKGGSFEKVMWQDVEIGDSARVKELNRMGLITHTYGRKFNIKFPNGTEKTFDASDLEFYKLEKDQYELDNDNNYAKGGVTYFDERNQHYLGRPSGSFEREIYAKVKDRIDADDFVGSFGWKISSNKKAYMADGFLYKLDDFDQNLIKDLKLKQGEKVFRYVNRTTAIGGMMPFIKINIEKALLYFPVSNDNDDIIFETRGVTPLWINLIEGSFADGGSVKENLYPKYVKVEKKDISKFKEILNEIGIKSPYSEDISDKQFNIEQIAFYFKNEDDRQKAFNYYHQILADGGSVKRTRRTKDQIRKDEYNKEVDLYNWYIVNVSERRVETGFEYKEDAIELLSDYDGDKNFKVVSKKTLKTLGIDIPNENWKYAEGGFMDNVYAKGGIVVTKIQDIPNLTEKVNKGQVTYRGLGTGKLANDFYNLAGERGTKIKVDGKEYFITDSDYRKLDWDFENNQWLNKIKFSAPTRNNENGGFMDNVYADGGKTDKKFYSLDQIEYDIEYIDKNGEKYSEIFNTKDEALKEIYRLEKLGFFVTSRKRSFKDDGTFNGYFAKGGGVGDNVLGLVKGDIFEVIDTEHTVTGQKFIFLDYEDKYGTIALKAIPYPPMLFKKLNDKDKIVYITDISSDGIKKLSDDKSGEMLVRRYKKYIQYNMEQGGFMNNVYAKGGKVGNEFNYRLLSRLVADCDYYLGNGNRAEKHLWAGNVDAQIKEMKSLWNGFPKDAKPDWLSMNDILDYEQKMKNKYADGGFMNNVYAKGGKLNNYDRDIVREDMENFSKIAKLSKDGNDFIERARNIKNISPVTSNWFSKKYDSLSMREASDRFVKDVKSGNFDIEELKESSNSNQPKYILKADIKTVTLKRNGKEVTYKGADVLNGANVLAKGGDISSKANYIPKRDVVEVELKDGSKVKPANGYWVKKGAEPIGAEPTPTTSGKSEPKISTTEIRKDARGNWRAENTVDDFNGYDWRISTIKTYSGNLVSSAQGGKTEATGTKGIVMFKYAPYEDPHHTLEVSKPKRLTDKVVSEQHDKALAKFKKFMETGMFKSGGKISNFDKLSAKVAKEYEGKPVKSQYQEEYGRYYSKEEAQEVGDKVAGKVKAMQTDSKAFGGLFSGAKKMMTPVKYPDLEGKQVALKTGKFVQVFSQSDDVLSVLEVGKVGSGERPHSINISEVDMDSFKSGGKVGTKKTNSGSETLKQANDLAKKIRMDGESWLDAKRRAFAQLKK